MSVRDDLQEKIEETRDDLAKLRKNLDDIEHLEQALRAANDGLAQAGYNVSELAGTTRIAQESLGTTLNALEEVTRVVQRLDPAAILSAIQATDTSIKSEVNDASNALTKTVSDHSQNLLESINANHETTQIRIREEGARLSQQQSKVVKLFTWMGAFTLLGISALVVLAIIIFINI